MNLLRIQDALKNASDQQLMQMMQAPDSTAPSYLVLSEIRRRKDMRAKQAPEGDSRRTVAEELTAPEDQGIRAMAAQMPEEPPQDVADQAGIEAMREGGVVRMQAGGLPPVGMPERSAPPPLDSRVATPIVPGSYDFGLGEQPPASEVNPLDDFIFGRSPQELRDIIARGTPNLTYGQRRQVSPGAAALAESARARLAELERVHSSVASLPTFSGEEGGLPTTPTTNQGQQGQQGQPGQGQQGQPGQGQQGQQQGQPGQPRPAGGGAAAPAAAATETTMPTLADLYRQNQGLFADGIGALRERAQQERVDPAARRNEALNMALIEAGLRIAGSRNPSLAGAIGEGAVPAVQSYSQQLGQIRAEQREARRDELELAKQELNRQFAIGQISAAEFRTRTDNINANIRAASAERAADRRAAAAESAADARHRSTMEVERFRAQNRPIDLSGIPSLISATGTQIRDIQRELSLIGGEPPREIRGRPNPDHQRWSSLTSQLNDLNTEMAEYRRMIRSGLPTRGATGQTGTTGATTLPSGARIENGRYIPAGS